MRTYGSMLALLLLLAGCSDVNSGGTAKQEQSQTPKPPAVQRFVSVGNDPEIALDTQEGMLCRTVPYPNDPLGILDENCAITAEQKKLGFVPDNCKSKQTWVRGETANNPKYASLPRCGKPTVSIKPDGTVEVR
jgi:hypothetical protein